MVQQYVENYPMSGISQDDSKSTYYNKRNSKSSLLNIEERLSGHSHLINSYIYGGIFGVLFWIYTFFMVILFLRKHLFYDVRIVGLLIILITSWFWDFFFSPFASRLQEAMLLVLIAIIIQKSELSIKSISKTYEKQE